MGCTSSSAVVEPHQQNQSNGKPLKRAWGDVEPVEPLDPAKKAAQHSPHKKLATGDAPVPAVQITDYDIDQPHTERFPFQGRGSAPTATATVTATVTATAPPVDNTSANEAPTPQPPAQVPWDYHDPLKWDQLPMEGNACSSTLRQSPIDLPPIQTVPPEALPLQLQYNKAFISTAFNNGHAIQVNFPENTSATARIVVGDSTYQLAQFHFHTKSEHTFQGRQLDLELHLVHMKVDGPGEPALVLGILFESSESDNQLPDASSFLNKLFGDVDVPQPAPDGSNNFARSECVFNLAHDLQLDALLNSGGYYSYLGSLTTPPCSEIVHWYVVQQPMRCTPEHVDRMLRALPDRLCNHRPVLPLGSLQVITRNPDAQPS